VSIYRVTGPRGYRGHPPGTTFEALLDPDVEARAIRHGAIELLEDSTPALQPGSYTPPSGWVTETNSGKE
jgi:hypothetical protein